MIKFDKMTIHCSATKNGLNISVDAIRKYHVEQRGFSDIGYHYVIDAYGNVHSGRSIVKQGAHVEGHNENNLGICIPGTDHFSSIVWNALYSLIKACQIKWDIPENQIFCHNEFDSAIKQGKTCPGFKKEVLASWLDKKDREFIKDHLLEV